MSSKKQAKKAKSDSVSSLEEEGSNTSSSSGESAEDTTSSSSDSESESGDQSQTSKSVERKINPQKQYDFEMPCLLKWNESLSPEMQNCIHGMRKSDQDLGVSAGIKKGHSGDFTPWWDKFTQPKQGPRKRQASKIQQSNDTYESWLTKSPDGGTSWLCEPGSSASVSLSATASKVVDIEVPSIYEQKPALKGRRALKRERKAEREKTLGKKWFEMKLPDVDDKIRKDMELIQMRGVLDPKRFYKKQDRKALPKYFQMGTVVDEGTDFYSSRLTKKQRKQTLVEELMADANVRQYNKRKYNELQQKMRSKKKVKPTGGGKGKGKAKGKSTSK